MKLVDTHSHVIPYWDDGSPSWEGSLDMLRQAQADGISKIVCTSHFMSKHDLQREDEIWPYYHELVERARNADIPVEILMGSELYLTPDLSLDYRVSTFAGNGRYFLVEFPMGAIPEYAAQMFFNFLMNDKIPVLAHPERNAGFLENPGRAYNFVERGTLLQVTAGSLLGNFGTKTRKYAFDLLDANLVQIVATDAHNLSSRPMKLSAAYHVVAENWGIERADLLFYENPEKLISGDKIIFGETWPVAKASKKNFGTIIKSVFKI